MKVLIGSPVRRDPATLRAFLDGLRRLDTDGIEHEFGFVNDNTDRESFRMTNEFIRHPETDERMVPPSYAVDGSGHHWSDEAVWRVAAHKDRILRDALEGGYDACLLVDSDIIMQPPTLKQLIAADKPVVSEIFWTRWPNADADMPQVWYTQPYGLCPVKRGKSVNPETEYYRTEAWLSMLRAPGIYPVGGLGALTLFRGDLIERMFRECRTVYGPLESLHLWGEDRHFCLRCDALGVQRWVDTHYPAFHVYRPSDLERLPGWIEETSKAQE